MGNDTERRTRGCAEGFERGSSAGTSEGEEQRPRERERKLRDAPETTENINQVNFTGNIPVSAYRV